jgi:hypothetical protein
MERYIFHTKQWADNDENDGAIALLVAVGTFDD